MPDDKVVALLWRDTRDINCTSGANKSTGLAQNTLVFLKCYFSFIGIHAFTFSFQSAQALTSPSTILCGGGGQPAMLTSTLTKRSNGPSME